MTAANIGAAKGGGYARYLEAKTVEPERGDYYLTPGGEPTQAPGRWLSGPDTLARLGIKTGDRVDGRDFVALMEGRHPHTGRWIRPEGAGGGRGGGIDVTFSAPKSVSVAWALADSWQRELIETAHARAVEQAVAYMRERVPLVRRRYDGQVVEEHAGDVFDRLSGHAPTAELTDIHRTQDPHERRAWQALRAGEPERAMAHYLARGQLHFQDTRDQAAETAVQHWHQLTKTHGLREVALIADASNQEIDRLNARAQNLRLEDGQLEQQRRRHRRDRRIRPHHPARQ
jgi:hypothetical protein